MFLKKFMLIKQANQKSMIFVTTGIFQVKGLSFKRMYAIDVMIYKFKKIYKKFDFIYKNGKNSNKIW